MLLTPRHGGNQDARLTFIYMRRSLALCIAAISVLPTAPRVFAADWPNWRGPTGNNSTSTGNYPTAWTVESVSWKFALPGKGSSTPIIWKDRIYLTTPDAGQGCRPGAGRSRPKAVADAARRGKPAQTAPARFELQCVSRHGWQGHLCLLPQLLPRRARVGWLDPLDERHCHPLWPRPSLLGHGHLAGGYGRACDPVSHAPRRFLDRRL